MLHRDPVGPRIGAEEESNERFSCTITITWRIWWMPCSEEAGTVEGGSVAGGPGPKDDDELAELEEQPVTSTNVNTPRAVRYRAREGRVIGQTVSHG